MLRFSWIALIASAALAQSPSPADVFNKPPAEVDQALRARISEFYELHVKGDFRKAEALVAEDTKDFYYNHNKPRYFSFEISRIDYSDNFTKAKATVLCEQEVLFPGFAGKHMKVPTASTWKLVDGKWYWYVDPDALRMTPFGKMTPGPGSDSGQIPVIPSGTNFVMNKIQADKKSVTLEPGESAEVEFTNSAPGNMDLALVGEIPGIEAKLSETSLKANSKAVLSLRASQSAKGGVLSVRVVQTGEVIPIQIAVK
jgi:hypothetical protein